MDRPETFEELAPITNADNIPRLSCSEALRQSGRKLKLFTPALLVTHGGFDRDPVIEFDARIPAPSADLRPFSVNLTRGDDAFFRGLGVTTLPGSNETIDWDRRIYAIDESRADECFGFLGGIAFSDPRRGYFANTLYYDLDVPDPTSKAGELLSVRVFGVMANTFTAFLEPRLGQPPIARRIANTNDSLTINLPKDNLFVWAPEEDPLNIRED